jgi:hypothetical protein
MRGGLQAGVRSPEMLFVIMMSPLWGLSFPSDEGWPLGRGAIRPAGAFTPSEADAHRA